MEEETLRSCIERMVAEKETMNTARDQLVDYRREARSDGLNIQALNPLVDILSEHPHDRGARVLTDLIYYAQVAGTNLPLSGNGTPAGRWSEGVPGQQTVTDTDLEASHSETPAERKSPRRSIVPSVRFAFDGVLAGSLSVFLVWLLN